MLFLRLSLFLCLPLLCAGQNELKRKYYYHDSCPDPLTNHIATRKVFKVYLDSNDFRKKADTVTEYYDRNGLLVSMTQQHPGWTSDKIYWHHFYYDKKGRIICDSTFNADGLRAPVTYEHTNNKSVRYWPAPRHYGDEYPTTVHIYDDNHKLIREYRINDKGDTMHAFYDCGKSSFSMWNHYNDSGDFEISSFTDCGYDSISSWERCYLYHNEYGTGYGSVNYYNDSGQVTVLVGYDDDSVDYYIFYYYENKRRCGQTTVQWTWGDTTYRHVTYKYDAQGHLIESREWNPEYETSDGYLIHAWKYNERGLRIEERSYRENMKGEVISEYSCERWEYTYYDKK